MTADTPASVTLRPTLRINGRAHAKLGELLLAMRLVESEGGMSSLELRLIDVASDPEGQADAAFDDETILGLGSPIEVYTGEETAPARSSAAR